MQDHEQVKQRDAEYEKGHHEAEEHEGNERRLAPVARAGQFFAGILAFQEIAQLETVQGRLHVGRRLNPQGSPLCIQGGMMLGAQFFAAAGDRFEALIQPATLQPRHTQGHHGGESQYRDKQRDQKTLVEQEVHDGVHLPLLLMFEVDHLAHHHDAAAHPEHTARQHQVAGALGEQFRDIGGGGEINDAHHARRQRTDDHGAGLGLR